MNLRTIIPPPARDPAFIWRAAAFFVIVALLLFVPAGSIYWLRGWLFIALNVILMSASIIYIGRVNPELFEARKHIQKGTKRWDKILLLFLSGSYAAVLVVAALDDKRYQWDPQLWRGVVFGWLLYAGSFVLAAWAEAVNRFFEPGVRIQTDRGHHVIDTGPYAVVRHPGYVAAIFLAAGTALSLGSLWALIPAAITSAIIVLRTALEDRMLQNELGGYKEYAQKVRFRLLPGIW
ncbi:MAG: isoprenylcysteine carboxylmethyltransferase family protein [Planctomycetaceae bacterium]|nr:isoprenylcysteine carboxylmethyltransferase family protein [Planctomycetaceae bacterium]